MDFSTLAREAADIQADKFNQTLDMAIISLQNEGETFGNQKISKRLVTLEPLGDALVIGDIHGDFESLKLVLRQSHFMEKMEKSADATLIFLGDYGDRGDEPAQVYHMVMNLKLAYPKQVVLLRGNHEGPKELMASPHDLPVQFQERFGEAGQLIYEKTRSLWTYLNNAVYVEDRFLLLHGGVSTKIRGLRDIAQANDINNKGLIEDMLWSDPVEGMNGASTSPRGAGKLFGRDVTEKVLERLGVEVLIRGHEPSDTGFKINHDGKVLTLFSRKGAPYFNRYGAYLQLPLSEKYESASQLVPFIHKI